MDRLARTAFGILLSLNILAQDVSDDEMTGDWTTGASWVDNTAPNNPIDVDVTIDGYITLNSNLNFTILGNDQLTVNAGDTLVINSGSNSLFFEGNDVVINGLLIVVGNLYLNSGTSFTIGSTEVVLVGGTLNGFNNPNTLDNSNGGELFVGSDTNEFAEDVTTEFGTGVVTTLGEAFTYIQNNSIVLPVDLLFFEAVSNGAEAVLTWSTASEINNHGFYIEKSDDGSDFSEIGFVQGNGTTNDVNNYSFTDRSLGPSAYYRLRQTDFDGESETFRAFFVQSLGQALTISPNPVLSKVVIPGSSNSLYSISLTTMAGKSVIRGDNI